MPGSTWVALGSLVVVVVTIVWRDGLYRGRILTLLERLADDRDDHEDRIRDLETTSRLYVAQIPPGAHRRRKAHTR